MDVTLTLKGDQATKAALTALGKDAAFVTAQAINATANAAQQAVRDNLTGFTLRRRDFILRTIYRRPGTDFAKKTDLRAALRVNPQRDVLAKHEEGGRKMPGAGGRTVAIPLEAVKPNEMAVIPRRLRPSQLPRDQVRRVETRAGTFLVRNRPGRGSGGRVGWRTEFLYRLKPSTPLRPRLRFVETANKAVDREWVGIALAKVAALLARFTASGSA